MVKRRSSAKGNRAPFLVGAIVVGALLLFLAGELFAWAVSDSGRLAVWRHLHLGDRAHAVRIIGRRRRALAIILVNAAGIALFVYFIKLSFILVPNAHLQTSASLGLPLSYVYAAVPVGSVLIILPMARVLLFALRDLWPRHS